MARRAAELGRARAAHRRLRRPCAAESSETRASLWRSEACRDQISRRRAHAVPATVAAAPPSAGGDEAAIRAAIATWYKELQKGAAREHWRLYAPGAIDGGPGETEINPRSRARSPTYSNELAARALQFSYDVETLAIDPHFAKVGVWERGYFYAWANQQTYENAASATFVLEKQPDGRWLILAHAARSVGIPATKRTVPLPDMKPLWQDRADAHGKTPAAD